MKQHSSRFLTLVQQTKSRIKEIDANTLKTKIDNKEKFYLIDVREEQEWREGRLPGAIHLSKGILERDIEKLIPDEQTPLVLYCSGGFRCALAAESLQKMGYSQVLSLDGGLKAWQDAGYPLSKT